MGLQNKQTNKNNRQKQKKKKKNQQEKIKNKKIKTKMKLPLLFSTLKYVSSVISVVRYIIIHLIYFKFNK